MVVSSSYFFRARFASSLRITFVLMIVACVLSTLRQSSVEGALLPFQGAPRLTITATNPTASESGPTEGVFVISRDGSTAQALTVHLTIGGAATNGVDYVSIPNEVQISAGAASVEVRVRPIDDSSAEAEELVTVGLSDVPLNSVTNNTLASVSIKDNDTIVEVTTLDPNGSESGPRPIVFSVTRVGDIRSQLTITLATNSSLISPNTGGSSVGFGDGSVRTVSPSGTTQTSSIQDGTSNTISTGERSAGSNATNGVDFVSPPATITFQVGETSKTINITPIDDRIAEATESVTLSVVRSPLYTLGRNSSAVGFIQDNDPPAEAAQRISTVSIAATQSNADEEGPTNGVVAITRTGPTAQPLEVFYSVNPTGVNIPNPATNGVDFDLLSGQAIIPAGQTSTTITVRPIDDNEHEPEERLVLQLVVQTPATYTVQAGSNQVTLKIKDHHRP
jgi:hypothetical protein